MPTTCSRMKIRKMGTRGTTDSLTPRRFSTVSNTTPATAAASLYWSQAAGRKLKTASTPLDTDSAMVNT